MNLNVSVAVNFCGKLIPSWPSQSCGFGVIDSRRNPIILCSYPINQVGTLPRTFAHRIYRYFHPLWKSVTVFECNRTTGGDFLFNL